MECSSLPPLQLLRPELVVQAVHEMPSGQAAPMIAFTARHIPALAALPGSCPQAAFGQVLASCLMAIRVEVVSAPTLASAAAALLTTRLNPALKPVLLQVHKISSRNTFQLGNQNPGAEEAATASAAAWLPRHAAASNSNDKPQHAQHAATAHSNFETQHVQQAAAAAGGQLQDLEESEQLIACLLRLYQGAVGLYGQCAATQLQIEPLPGQGTGLSTHEPSQQSETGQSRLCLVSALTCRGCVSVCYSCMKHCIADHGVH